MFPAWFPPPPAERGAAASVSVQAEGQGAVPVSLLRPMWGFPAVPVSPFQPVFRLTSEKHEDASHLRILALLLVLHDPPVFLADAGVARACVFSTSYPVSLLMSCPHGAMKPSSRHVVLPQASGITQTLFLPSLHSLMLKTSSPSGSCLPSLFGF